MSENYYNILGVNENATKEEIKKAYRTLQMKYHPDRNPGNQECIIMTQKLNEAYEILGDDQKREEYNMTKNNPFMRMNSNGPHNMEVPLNDIINMMFGGSNIFGDMPGMQGFSNGTKIHIFHGGQMNFQQAMQKPVPIMFTLQIQIQHVVTGGYIPIEIERWVMQNGNRVTEKENIYVEIPQGVDDNEIIILRDKGNVINENCKGDIKITIQILNDSEFKRSGLDLTIEKNISLKDSLCGFTFEINHINGKSYTLNNNKGSIVPPEYKKVYPGMGLKRGEHNGNMIIHFHVNFPEKLTDEQIDKLIEIL
jgi:DnaJ-class molecular chaperone